MYNSDSPIKESSQDLLKRSDFASKLAESLISYEDKASLCVGLLGPWGSGKTSLVNLVINDIQEKTQDLPEEDQPIILRFNPWNFTSSDQLLHQFFMMLADQFTGKKDADISVIGEAISDYGSTLELIPKVGNVASKSSGIIGRFIKNRTLHGSDVGAQRKRIIDLLDKQTHKVIITIDDIDRLNNNEVQLIFKLVAAVANFPNTIFLLSFDKDIVVRALDNYQGDDGNKFLEKIIQVVVNIPPASKAQLIEIFDNYFEPLKKQYPEMIWSPGYWNLVSPHVFDLIANVRDISRLFNTVQLKLSMIGKEINFADLVMITVLELKKPRFYEWIRNNKSVLVKEDGGFLAGLLGRTQSPDEWKEKYRKDLTNAGLSMGIDECQEILSLLFPVYAARIGAYSYYSNDSEQLVRDQRIGHSDKFDRYFILSIGDEQIPREYVGRAVEKYPVDKLESFIKGAIQTYNPGNVITEIDALAPVLTDERAKILLITMLKSMKYFKASKYEFYYSSAKGRAEDLCITLMDKIGKDATFDIMKAAIQGADVSDLEGIAYILDIMLISYNRIRQNSGFPQVVTEEHLDDLGKNYINRIYEIDAGYNLLSLDNSQCIWIIQYFDKEKYAAYIQNKLKDSDLNKLMYVSSTIGMATGSDGEYYQIDNNSERKEFITDEEIDKAIKNCVNDKSINQLSKDQALRVAAYSLRNSNFDKEMGVSEAASYQLLQEWGYLNA